MKFKGITVGTYISKKTKGKYNESICANCEKNKNIDLEKGTITIRRTQTKDTNGKSRIGETTKTFSGQRILDLNDISRKALAEAKIDPNVLKGILGHSDISIMKYYVDIDTDFIKSENKNVVNYLINKNIFGVILDKGEIAV